MMNTMNLKAWFTKFLENNLFNYRVNNNYGGDMYDKTYCNVEVKGF